MILDISNGNIVIEEDGYYEILGSTTNYNIYINCKATIILNNVDIDVKRKSKAAIVIDELGDITLTFKGRNSLKSDDNYAGIQIKDKGKLLIKGDIDATLNIESGTSGAGIGGGYGEDFEGVLIIETGVINILSTREGAGIGGGNGGYGGGHLSGDVIIEGGNINITSGNSGGSGIGGGSNADLSGNVVINGGQINTFPGENAIGSGIGGGYDGNLSGNVIINGGQTLSIGGEASSGIGAGVKINRGGSLSGTVTVNGGVIVAKGGNYIEGSGGSGIGGGYGGDLKGNIILNNGNITAIGAGNANDIGAGSNGEISGEISIKVYKIEVDPTYLYMNIGENYKIKSTLTIDPSINAHIEDLYKVLYFSNDENVAVVNEEGIVNAISEGETQIVATPLYDKTKHAICNVTVKKSNVIELGKIDLIIDVEKDEINLQDIDNIICYGNNPVIKNIFANYNIKSLNKNIELKDCKEKINVAAKYKETNIYLALSYSIVLYSLNKFKVYALKNDYISSNLIYCSKEDYEFDINKFEIVIDPIYEIDADYSSKYYIFKISGNIFLVEK